MLRLLAWTVADARGAVKIMTKANALVVGKRLYKQAGKVRDEMQLASSTAAQERCDLAGHEPALSRRRLAEEHAQINAKEQRTFDNADMEVYVGFSELIELLQPHPPPEPLPPPARRAAQLCVHDEATRDAWRRAGEAHARAGEAWERVRRAEQVPPLPADLVASLAPDGLQLLFTEWTDSMQGRDPGEWWSYLPNLVNLLTCELAQARAARRRLEVQHEEELRWLRASEPADVEPADDHRDEMIRECETDIDILTVELAASEAKVEVLSEV